MEESRQANPEDVRIIDIEPFGKTTHTIFYVMPGDPLMRSHFIRNRDLDDMDKQDVMEFIARYETVDIKAKVQARRVIDLVKIGDNIYPVQVDQDVDMYEQRPRTKDNLPFKIRHRKRFRNESDGMAEGDFDGMAGGTRNQNRGMGTDQSYSIPGQGIGGAALGY